MVILLEGYRRKLLLLVLGLVLAGNIQGQRATSRLLSKLLKQSDHPIVQRVIGAPDTFQLQIIYESIRRDQQKTPTFRRYMYRIDTALYFYPASTVKLAQAVVALEKLHDLGLSPGLTFHTDSVRYPQKRVTTDTTARDSRPTIAHYIDMMFVVSDNEASNRLYEFIGPEELHRRLNARGFTDTRIAHRLGDSRFGPEENRYTNPVYFLYGVDTVYRQAEQVAEVAVPLQLKKIRRGIGYCDSAGNLIQVPFDFSLKNRFGLGDQMDMLKAVLFPLSLPKQRRFSLDSASYVLLKKAMSRRPRESEYPLFDTAEYPDTYVKFFLFGDTGEPIPPHFRIFNKVGWAYGFLTETAYIIDTHRGIEFLVSATLEVNPDGIYNDDQYAYDTIGIPFLAELGRILYRYEVGKSERKRKGNKTEG